MNQIYKAKNELQQSQVDFFRPICFKELLEEQHQQTASKNIFL